MPRHTVRAWSGENQDRRPFTVQDAIEISYIIDAAGETNIVERGAFPPGGAIMAPNGKYFLVVTQRGLLATNRLEATLWLFDRQAIADFVSGKSLVKPSPRHIAQLSARSNTPVISAVRWLEHSDRIAFLGKNDSPYQQLFIADLRKGSVEQVTRSDAHVTAYDVRDDTIAYTTLDQKVENAQPEFVDVTGKTIYSLLFPKNFTHTEDFNEGWVETIPSVLHVERKGKELTIPFLLDGKPLRLFKPSLALSPDCKSLITVAPVREIPSSWPEYAPLFEAGFRYRPGEKFATADDNPWKASYFVVVDLQNGVGSVLVDAPAGRGLGFLAPTKPFWFPDNQRVILCNTFLPVHGARNERDRSQRSRQSAVAFSDVVNRNVQGITYISQPPFESETFHRISDVEWNEEKQEVTLVFATLTANSAGAPPPETYTLKSGEWVKIQKQSLAPGGGSERDDLEISVQQDLNHPPVLSGHLTGKEGSSIIWDPNPQLERIQLSEASYYHWKDNNGNSWSGILVLPPGYDPRVRYPLVLQTHAHDPDTFFADGAYTTASAGRALVAKGVIVLQIGMIHINAPTEGPDQIRGMESAIESLASAGMVDARRVGIIGFSRTCFHVLYAMTHHPDLFAAASITDGLNFGYFQYILLSDQFNYQDLFERMNGGSPFGSGLKNWASNAPGFNLDKIKTPLLIAALERGELMTEWESYSGLHRLRKPVDMVWLREENAPHILVQPRQRYVSQQGAVDWFVFWLKGDEDTDPTKAEQYARWRELRRLQEENEKKSVAPPN